MMGVTPAMDWYMKTVEEGKSNLLPVPADWEPPVGTNLTIIFGGVDETPVVSARLLEQGHNIFTYIGNYVIYTQNLFYQWHAWTEYMSLFHMLLLYIAKAWKIRFRFFSQRHHDETHKAEAVTKTTVHPQDWRLQKLTRHMGAHHLQKNTINSRRTTETKVRYRTTTLHLGHQQSIGTSRCLPSPSCLARNNIISLSSTIILLLDKKLMDFDIRFSFFFFRYMNRNSYSTSI